MSNIYDFIKREEQRKQFEYFKNYSKDRWIKEVKWFIRTRIFENPFNNLIEEIKFLERIFSEIMSCHSKNEIKKTVKRAKNEYYKKEPKLKKKEKKEKIQKSEYLQK